MAHTLFSLLLLRRLSRSSPSPRLSRLVAIKPFTSSAPAPPALAPPSDPAASSLSARMSFVFDQIDAIEKERSEKDETLQRIRAWRATKNAQSPELESELSAATNPAEAETVTVTDRPEEAEVKRELELVHPWPEWIELMERLVQQNYFDHRRKDEEKMIQDLGFDASSSRDSRVCEWSGLDFKNFRVVQTAFLNFGKDRFDILRSLSRQDIQILVGLGCPSADKKVVFSAKLLRKHVHLDEGDVCSSCSLRNSCDRAYLLTLKEDEARTIDIMRVLLDYGFDPLNQPLLKQKSVKNVVRKMLHQVVKLSSVPIDPNLPPPIFKKPPLKVKIPPPPPRKRVGRDDIEMKKGDWLCPKCDFMNFAKNCVCLQCDAKRPKRELLPGEWECPQCNFLNYRRNTVCFHCDCKRPLDEFTESRVHERQVGPRPKVEKLTNLSEASKSNAWNFDFDDDESDGADVAAFEYADSSVIPKGSLDNYQTQQDNFRKTNRDVRVRGREYSDTDTGRSTGFNDFDDEDDDVDNYEIDTGNRSSVKMVSSNDLSEFEGDSGSEEKYPAYSKQSRSNHIREFSDSDDDEHNSDSEEESSVRSISRRGPKDPSNAKKPRRKAFSGSDDDELDSDSDNKLSANPKWKSSHVSDSRPKGKESRPWKDISFVSDDELGFNSDVDDKPEKVYRPKGGRPNETPRRGSLRGRDPFSDSESENDSRSFGNRSRRNAGPRQRDAKFGSNNMKNDRRKSFEDDDDDDLGRSERGSHSGFRGNSFGSRTNDRKGGMRNDRRKLFEDDSDDDDDRSLRNSRGNGFRGNSFGSRTDNSPKGKRSDQRKSFDDNDRPRSSRGSNGNGFRGNNSGSRMNDRRGGSSSFNERKSGGFRKQGEKQGYGRDRGEKGSEEFKNSRRVIER